MFRFIKDYFFSLVTLLFTSFYASYFVTVNYQIISVHKNLISNKEFDNISFGIITFIIFAFLPILLTKMTTDSEIPLLRDTFGLRSILSIIAIVYTVCLFISKSIFNSIAKDVMALKNGPILDSSGKVVLIEILSIAIPFVLFLYFSKKVVSYFLKKLDEKVD